MAGPGARGSVRRRGPGWLFLAGLTGGRPARRSEFTMTREQATRRVAQGITLADFLQAFRIGQITLWHRVLAAAGEDPAARDAALTDRGRQHGRRGGLCGGAAARGGRERPAAP